MTRLVKFQNSPKMTDLGAIVSRVDWGRVWIFGKIRGTRDCRSLLNFSALALNL